MNITENSTKEELNKTIYELATLIQKMCKEGSPSDISLLTGIVESTASLVSATPYNILE